MKTCTECGHNSVACVCGLSYRERLLGLQINESSFDTGTKRNYFDEKAVEEVFGHDATEKYWQMTQGRGALERDAHGEYQITDYKGETRRPTAKDWDALVDDVEGADVV